MGNFRLQGDKYWMWDVRKYKLLQLFPENLEQNVKNTKINLSFSLNFVQVLNLPASSIFNFILSLKGKVSQNLIIRCRFVYFAKAFDVSLLNFSSDYLNTSTACYEFSKSNFDSH